LNKKKYEKLIFFQNKRRWRLRNFQNFRYFGGDGCIFFEKIVGGGLADRLLPLNVTEIVKDPI
jgi:hypothetical protein